MNAKLVSKLALEYFIEACTEVFKSTPEEGRTSKIAEHLWARYDFLREAYPIWQYGEEHLDAHAVFLNLTYRQHKPLNILQQIFGLFGLGRLPQMVSLSPSGSTPYFVQFSGVLPDRTPFTVHAVASSSYVYDVRLTVLGDRITQRCPLLSATPAIPPETLWSFRDEVVTKILEIVAKPEQVPSEAYCSPHPHGQGFTMPLPTPTVSAAEVRELRKKRGY